MHSGILGAVGTCSYGKNKIVVCLPVSSFHKICWSSPGPVQASWHLKQCTKFLTSLPSSGLAAAAAFTPPPGIAKGRRYGSR